MTAYWALFGEKNKGHDLLAHTGTTGFDWKQIAAEADLPEGLAGVFLQRPVLAGFPALGGYVFTWMLSHREATRPGMVLTLACRVDPTEDAVLLEKDLQLILGIREIQPDVWLQLHEKKVSLSSFIETLVNPQGLASPNAVRPLVRSLFVPDGPAVWVPEAGFPEAVLRCWLSLWPEAREDFTFRYSQGPNDIGTQEKPTVVYSPSGTERKWLTHNVVSASSTLALPSSLSALLLEGDKQAEEFRDFLQVFERPPASLRSLQQHEKVFLLWKSVKEGKVQYLPALIQVLLRFPISKQKGQPILASLENILDEVIARGDLVNLQSLANLDLAGLASGEQRFIERLRQRSEEVADGLPSQEDFLFLELLLGKGSKAWWVSALKPAVVERLQQLPPVYARAVWEWARQPTLLANLTPLLSAATDQILADHAPGTVDEAALAGLAQWGLDQKWPHLSALGLARMFPPHKAVEVYLSLFPGKGNLVKLLSRLDMQQVQTLIPTAKAALLQEIAPFAATHPEVFSRLEVEQEPWRTLWGLSVQQGMHPFADPRLEQVTVPYLELMEKEPVLNANDLALLRAMGDSGKVSLLNHPFGETLLRKLPVGTREGFVKASQAALVSDLQGGVPVHLPLAWHATLLTEAFVQQAMREKASQRDFAGQLWAVLKPHLSERQLQAFLNAMGRNRLPNAVLREIGDQIISHGWQTLARNLSSMLGWGNPNLNFLLKHCRELFPFKDRVLIEFLSATPEQHTERGEGHMESIKPSMELFLAEHPQNQDNLESLVRQVQLPQGVVPFVGAGVSFRFGMALWSGFLKKHAERLGRLQEIQALMDAGKYEKAAQELYDDLTPTPFLEAVKNEYGDHKLKDVTFDRTEKWVLQLASGAVVTTNFDRVLEHTANHMGRPFYHQLVGAGHQATAHLLQSGGWGLIKLHGDWAGEESQMVFTEAQYNQHYGEGATDFSRPIPSVLANVLRGKSVLFLGASLEQDRTMTLLRELNQQNSSLRHYALLSSPTDEAEKTRKRRHLGHHGILPLWYPSEKHEYVELLLQYLVQMRQTAHQDRS